MYIERIGIDIYKFNFYFIISNPDDIKNLVENVWKVQEPHADYNVADGVHFFYKCEHDEIKNGIWIDESITNIVEVLSHEVFHLTCRILREVSIKLTRSSEEAYAYLIGYLSQLLYNKWENHFSNKENP